MDEVIKCRKFLVMQCNFLSYEIKNSNTMFFYNEEQEGPFYALNQRCLGH